MKIVYQIHLDFDHCSVNFNDKVYSYKSLKKMVIKEYKIYSSRYKNISKNKPNSKSIDIESDETKFYNSKLTLDEIKGYLFHKKQSEAKSWISSQRKKRKEGKLTQAQVDDLNRLGMVWNPSTDEWEKYYNLYRGARLMEILNSMKIDAGGCGDHWIQRFMKLEGWIVEQSELHIKGKLSKENLLRLNAIGFPFKSPAKSKSSLELNILLLLNRIRDLREGLIISGTKKDFLKYYGLKQKIDVGNKIEISEKVVFNKREKEKEKDLQERLSFNNSKWEKKEQKIIENEMEKLVTKSNSDFLKLINEISTIGKVTSNQKNNFYVNSEGRKIPLYIDKYMKIYNDLQNFIENRFAFRAQVEHYKTDLSFNFKFDNEVKIYSAEKMLLILDNPLLKSGILNSQKRFKPISFLLDTYLKEKNTNGIIKLKSLIENHELLNLIYKERLTKIIKKMS